MRLLPGFGVADDLTAQGHSLVAHRQVVGSGSVAGVAVGVVFFVAEAPAGFGAALAVTGNL